MDEQIQTLQKQLDVLKGQMQQLKDDISKGWDEQQAVDDLLEENAKRNSITKSTYIGLYGDKELKSRYNIVEKSNDEIPPRISLFGTITKGDYY